MLHSLLWRLCFVMPYHAFLLTLVVPSFDIYNCTPSCKKMHCCIKKFAMNESSFQHGSFQQCHQVSYKQEVSNYRGKINTGINIHSILIHGTTAWTRQLPLSHRYVTTPMEWDTSSGTLGTHCSDAITQTNGMISAKLGDAMAASFFCIKFIKVFGSTSCWRPFNWETWIL